MQAEGIFIGHPKGFGFVEIEGQEEDIFIPEENTGTAVNQDKVRIIIKDEQREGKRREGIVVEVLERGMEQIVGTYQLNREFGFVISDNPKFSNNFIRSEIFIIISILQEGIEVWRILCGIICKR